MVCMEVEEWHFKIDFKLKHISFTYLFHQRVLVLFLDKHNIYYKTIV